MKKCRTVNGLVSAIKKKEKATLVVWKININHFDSEGAYLNLGEGKFAYASEKIWNVIKNYIIKPNGERYSDKELSYPFN